MFITFAPVPIVKLSKFEDSYTYPSINITSSEVCIISPKVLFDTTFASCITLFEPFSK